MKFLLKYKIIILVVPLMILLAFIFGRIVEIDDRYSKLDSVVNNLVRDIAEQKCEAGGGSYYGYSGVKECRIRAEGGYYIDRYDWNNETFEWEVEVNETKILKLK